MRVFAHKIFFLKLLYCNFLQEHRIPLCIFFDISKYPYTTDVVAFIILPFSKFTRVYFYNTFVTRNFNNFRYTLK